MSATATFPHEKVEIRVARNEYACWSWAEKCSPPGDGYDGGPPCTRVIGEREQHVVSTIFPGHDSGYCDDRVRWDGKRWVPVPASPISSRFCMPCARRWHNLRRGLDKIEAARVGAA